MRTVFVITDHSPEADHAATFALMIAQAVHADLLIADTVKAKRITIGEPVLAGAGAESAEEPYLSPSESLRQRIDPDAAYLPEISELDISDLPLDDLIALIIRRDIWLMVEGMPDTLSKASSGIRLNIQSVLNRVRCPLMLIPKSWGLKRPERIVYLADLRYCRQFVLKFLGLLAAPFDAGISVAHLSAKGLTDIADSYAEEIFRKDIHPHAHYEKIMLSNTRERDLHLAVDVLINGLHNDLMVLVNHRYHFEELIGRRIGDVLPADITIPILIFPL
ncbi:MAG: hypothetical protein V4577_06185 [Bacteroidota bacterium]